MLALNSIVNLAIEVAKIRMGHIDCLASDCSYSFAPLFRSVKHLQRALLFVVVQDDEVDPDMYVGQSKHVVPFQVCHGRGTEI